MTTNIIASFVCRHCRARKNQEVIETKLLSPKYFQAVSSQYDLHISNLDSVPNNMTSVFRFKIEDKSQSEED